ncbi:STM4015 family protein [Nonomuraea pusilla]|uniref:STM4015 family protein n=1 Tax=Nonomuraea pusilla TaxID=46177 RepID=UPI003332D23A
MTTDHDWYGYKNPYLREYAGLPVTQLLPEDVREGLPADHAAVAWRLSASEDGDDHDSIAESFEEFFADVDTERVRAIVVGAWEDSYDTASDQIVRILTENAGRLPALRSLFLGAIHAEEAEISWIAQSDVTPLLEAYPRLERLEVRGGSGLRLSPVTHEALRVLRLETGGLPGEVTRAVGASTLPELEHLELWLGVESYGGTTTVADLEPILSGARLPRLRHLGLQDSEIQDEIAAAVAYAPVVARLESLSLSMGTLGDAGAEALLAGQPLTHLRRLDLHHHFLSDPMARRLSDALSGVEIDLSGQARGHRSGGVEWHYVAVSE